MYVAKNIFNLGAHQRARPRSPVGGPSRLIAARVAIMPGGSYGFSERTQFYRRRSEPAKKVSTSVHVAKKEFNLGAHQRARPRSAVGGPSRLIAARGAIIGW